MARQFLCEVDAPVVQTKYGKLRGFQLDGTYTFYGIKYANAKRWQMPTEPDSWDGMWSVNWKAAAFPAAVWIKMILT